MQQPRLFTVKTQSGITFTVEAASLSDAWSRARSPVIAMRFSRMMVEAVSHIDSVEPLRGPSTRAAGPILTEGFLTIRG